ncbi:hypothetical protein SALWKB12_2186 [Snodgrassella communis]|uniref:Uncharacterized protein n=1 Tax=Snodgrassella communis TaxID=2946699 RepID=A0A836MQB4_9NEIS|nr:hypothetical protein SALWKB12_2186 [Snodgrassella communis]KDN14177.1 hypothetical protein SALWKB29_1838 [Snodgrassella communis]
MARTNAGCYLLQHIGGFKKLLTNWQNAKIVTQLIIESVI